MMYQESMYRVKKYDKGWVVEIKKPKWTLFGIKYKWVHYISYTGLSENPFYFTTKESALGCLLSEVKWGVLRLL